jgi:hypothetical protein
MKKLSSSETSVLTRATGRNIPEDTILHINFLLKLNFLRLLQRSAEPSFTTEQCLQVKLWLTFNEPLTFMEGYASVIGMAPSINTPGIGDYLAAHTVIHSHARIYHLYDKEFRAQQGGTFKEFRRILRYTRLSVHRQTELFAIFRPLGARLIYQSPLLPSMRIEYPTKTYCDTLEYYKTNKLRGP